MKLDMETIAGVMLHGRAIHGMLRTPNETLGQLARELINIANDRDKLLRLATHLGAFENHLRVLSRVEFELSRGT